MQGENSTPHLDPTDPLRRRANKHTGHGTYANDCPLIIRMISCDTGEPRWWFFVHANQDTCRNLMDDNVPAGSPTLYTDEWQSDHGSHAAHATGAHDVHEWAREDNRDGQREVHCTTCEGAGAALRTYLRAFRGVHKQSLPLSGGNCSIRVEEGTHGGKRFLDRLKR